MSDDDANLTWVNGRAFRDESREPSPKYGVTTDDMARVRARTVEAAEFRQKLGDLARKLIKCLEDWRFA